MDTSPAETAHEDALIMAPSIGLRFSGINATMEALLPVMRQTIPIACCGKNLSDKMPVTTLWKWLTSKKRHQWRIWHSRRNNDMLVGLLLRHVLRQKLILLFTSAGQRDHSWLTKFCYHRMDAVIATTRMAAGFLKCDSTVSQHGVDTSVYTPPVSRSQMRKQLGLEDRPTIGVFGRVRPQKGTCDFVEALCSTLSKHPEWQVLFVGKTTEQYLPYKAQLESKLKAAGLSERVKFIGFLADFSELPKWYQAVDVVGCVSRVEGFGVTCLEGMASGTPVLATRAGAWEDIITDGQDGWIANANDQQDLARALRLTLSTTPQQLKRMGEKALSTIHERFTIQHEVNRIVAVYQTLFERYGEDWQEFAFIETMRQRAA